MPLTPLSPKPRRWHSAVGMPRPRVSAETRFVTRNPVSSAGCCPSNRSSTSPRDLFPASTKGAGALATVAAVVTKLTAHADSKNQSAEEEKQVKTAARVALLNHLRATSRTARTIGRETPGFQNRFRLPKSSKQTDQSILSSGRNFCKETAAEKARFLELGMRDTFVEDLESPHVI